MATSAIVVTFHTGGVLWDCLRAALAQCDEVVVVDNGNPDAVSARLAGDPHILHHASPGNVGFGWAANVGAGLAQGTHLLFLNPDAVLRPGAVEALLTALGDAKAPAIAGARLVDAAGVELRGSRRRSLTPLNLLRGLNLHREPLPGGPAPVGAVSGAAFMVRRADWEALGGFDPAYFLHVEDLDLCWRAHGLGGDVLFVPGAEAVHAGATSDAPSWVVETHKLMGLRTYLTRHFPRAGRLAWPAIGAALARRRRRG